MNEHELGSFSPKEPKELGEELFSLQEKANDGRGVSSVRDVVSFLRRDEIDKAKALCYSEADKIGSHPDIKSWIQSNLFGAEDNNPWKLLDEMGKSK